MPQTQLAPLAYFPVPSKKSKPSSASSSSSPSSSTASLVDGKKSFKGGLLSALLRRSKHPYTYTSDAILAPDAQSIASRESTATLVASPPKKSSSSPSTTTTTTPTRKPSPDEVLGQMASKYGYGLPMGRYHK